jgi:hypothetical protein
MNTLNSLSKNSSAKHSVLKAPVSQPGTRVLPALVRKYIHFSLDNSITTVAKSPR